MGKGQEQKRKEDGEKIEIEKRGEEDKMTREEEKKKSRKVCLDIEEVIAKLRIGALGHTQSECVRVGGAFNQKVRHEALVGDALGEGQPERWRSHGILGADLYHALQCHTALRERKLIVIRTHLVPFMEISFFVFFLGRHRAKRKKKERGKKHRKFSPVFFHQAI